ncbi:hypothetical protein WOLCODRAFT_144233 [Wolfiporia cocos MD-104 SS10]|uniref:Uncharacterized protein n=1 Tax=Wolfiporia cocos (strain MD-104) TaxID=742152 RepID=A0A2H3K349_WOLCO|nr:hypothetical protein WOLCODRAFT_144233 [Wolfiporia cocos MD-104 SS10]
MTASAITGREMTPRRFCPSAPELCVVTPGARVAADAVLCPFTTVLAPAVR